MTEEEQLKWGSHQPALMACVAATIGPVLEVGIGHFSTPLLSAYCRNADRKLISLEKNDVWFCAFAQAEGKNHRVIKVDDYAASVASYMQHEWSVCFIDNEGGGQARACLFALALPKCQFVVVHDYHRENEEAIGPLLSGVSHFVTNTYEPPTLVASMKRDVTKMF